VESTGAAKITLDGNVDDLVTDMTGASKLEANSLQTKTAEISSTGASHAEVAASESLKVSITGAGKVIYSGNQPTSEKHSSGVGSIRHKEQIYVTRSCSLGNDSKRGVPLAVEA